MADTSTWTMNDREATMRRAYNHYQGNPKRPLLARAGEPDDNVIISLARLIVDKGASFLFGDLVQYQVMTPEPEPKQDWLDECWRRNQRGLTLLKTAINGGIYGHAMLRVLPARQDQQYPRIVVLDTSIVEVQTNPDDVDDPWTFIIQPPQTAMTDVQDQDQELRRRTIIQNPSGQAGYQVNATGWFIQDQQYSAGAWITVTNFDWPYSFCPIIQCQNIPRSNSFWGESDLPADVLQILESIDTTASHMQKTLRLFSHPKVFTTGMGQRTIDMGIDSVIHLPSETATMGILQMQSDLSGALNFLNWLLNQLAMIVRIPLVAMGLPDTLGTLSGVSLQIRYQPLLEKTQAKRLTYGELLIELNQHLLEMGGFGANIMTNLTWPEVLPEDTLQERQVAVLDDSLGLVSKETLSNKIGYNWEKENALIDQERQDDIAKGVIPDPMAVPVPPPAPLTAPFPDIAKGVKSG